MPRFLTNRKWVSIPLGIVFIAVLFLWIPFLWHGRIEFDEALFATEYYKFLVDIGKILFSFWLANIFFQRFQTEEFSEHVQNQWQMQKVILLKAIEMLKSVPNKQDINVRNLKEDIKLGDMKLCYLSGMVSSYARKDKLGLLGIGAYEYMADLHLNVVYLVDALENGEIIELKPLEDEIYNRIESLIIKLSV